jgi:hypothetical protein
VSAANVVLRGGGRRTAVTRVCRSATKTSVSCDGPLRSIVLRPTSPLVPGRDYLVLVDPPGAVPIVDRVGNPAPGSVHPFEATRSVEPAHAPVKLAPRSAWKLSRSPSASGGSFATAERAGSTATIRFDGTGIDWVTVTGPNRGRARIWIDGDRLRIVDLFSTRRTFGVVEPISGLADRSHTLRIEVLGTRSSRSHGRWVPIDRFLVTGP